MATPPESQLKSLMQKPNFLRGKPPTFFGKGEISIDLKGIKTPVVLTECLPFRTKSGSQQKFMDMENRSPTLRQVNHAGLIGAGLGHLAKHFPITPPPGTQVLVIDSCSDWSKVEQAMIELGKVGMRAAEAGKSLRRCLLGLDSSNLEKGINKKRFPIPENKDVSYGKRQANKWAYKYSHKRPNKL